MNETCFLVIYFDPSIFSASVCHYLLLLSWSGSCGSLQEPATDIQWVSDGTNRLPSNMFSFSLGKVGYIHRKWHNYLWFLFHVQGKPTHHHQLLDLELLWNFSPWSTKVTIDPSHPTEIYRFNHKILIEDQSQEPNSAIMDSSII